MKGNKNNQFDKLSFQVANSKKYHQPGLSFLYPMWMLNPKQKLFCRTSLFVITAASNSLPIKLFEESGLAWKCFFNDICYFRTISNSSSSVSGKRIKIKTLMRNKNK